MDDPERPRAEPDVPEVAEAHEIKRYRLERPPGEAPVRVGDWARGLNAEQLAAVTAPDGPVLVLAGAGSGKTRVITYRVAYLIVERGVKPQQIMLATFTNKAARAMLARCEEVVGAAAHDVTGGTFHHIANLLLRRYAKVLGYEANFTILDESDQRSVMRACRVETGVDTKERAFPSDRLLVDLASAVVNTHSPLDQLLGQRYPHLYDRLDDIERVLTAYHIRKQACNQMDFDDLLTNLLRLLTDHPDVRRALARRYLHVLVDEYQDVNHVQGALVKELFHGEDETQLRHPADRETPDSRSAEADPAESLEGRSTPPPGLPHPAATAPGGGMYPAPGEDEGLLPPEGLAPPPGASVPEVDAVDYGYGRGLFVVGDDAQSIYSFRGADYRNIRSFPQAFPGAKVYKLETNYRSVPQVLDLANGIMRDSDPLFRKRLTPVRPAAADRPLLLACRDADEQAEFTAAQVLKLREDHGYAYSDLAVLYRAHNNRLEVELEFTKRGIPFVVRGGLRFFEQAHIKDLLSYLVVLENRRDELAWQRMLGMCARVGPKTIGSVLTDLRQAGDDEGGPLGRFVRNGIVGKQRGAAKDSLGALRDFLRELEAEAASLPVSELIERVLARRYRGYLELEYENWRARLEDLEQLAVYASRFATLTAFLAEVGLSGSFTGHELRHEGAMDDPEEGAVTLSTIHQAKGLEWRGVFLIHVQDDVIPHRMSQGDPAQEEEEQRLLYVAVTRAKELLFLTYPQLTQTRDFQRLINRPSRFLTGLPSECYDEGVLEWSGE